MHLGGSLLLNGNRAALTMQIATISKQEVYRKALRWIQPYLPRPCDHGRSRDTPPRFTAKLYPFNYQ
ncbi:hypothetical protein CXK96_01405 [Stutzerimonas stutzeri]|nr:hypothetical protein CXK96_01405 [Stutzerimonas stutzeri]